MIPQSKYAAIAKDFTYDAESGHLCHLDGRRASIPSVDGYRYLSYRCTRFLEHRVIWFIAYGYLPQQVDHVNLRRSDNRLSNLREATLAENCRNKNAQSNNALGLKGVSFHKSMGRYCARISINNRRILLGYFTTAAEASNAYQHAAKEHHGPFARF